MMLKLNVYSFIIVALFLVSCNTDCVSTKHEKIIIDEVEITLPDCYILDYPDSINYPTHGYIYFNGYSKIDFHYGSSINLEIFQRISYQPNIETYTDTTNGIFKHIGINKKGTGIWATIVDLNDTINLFGDHQFPLLFLANSYHSEIKGYNLNDDEKKHILTKQEQEMFFEIFKSLKYLN